MVLQLGISFDAGHNVGTAERVRRAAEKREAAKYEPTWEEVWQTGYGKKKGIFLTALSDADRRRLGEVKAAIESGELGPEVESLRGFTKAHALRLYDKLQRSRKDSIIARMLQDKPSNYVLIQTEDALDNLVADLANETIVAVDTETTGLDVHGGDVIAGLSFSLPRADYHVHVPVAHQVGRQLSCEYVLSRLAAVRTNEHVEKVFHNAKFDLHMLIHHGIRVRGKIRDTRIIVDPRNRTKK